MARCVLIALGHLVARSAVLSRIMPLVGLRLCRPLSRAAPPKPSPQSSALLRVSSPPGRVSHSPGEHSLARRFQLDFTCHVVVLLLVCTRHPIFFDHGTFHDMHMIHPDTLGVV